MIAKDRMIVVAILLGGLLFSGGLFAQKDDAQTLNTAGSVWTEADWAAWWTAVEDLYLAGTPAEDLYWLLRTDLEYLGMYEPVLQQINYPAPSPGWDDGGSGGPGLDPYSTPGNGARSGRHGGGSAPGSGGGPTLQHKCNLLPGETRCPSISGPFADVAPPPMWVAAGMVALGDLLQDVPHSGVKTVGKVMTRGGTIIIVWIEVEDDENEGDEEGE